MSKTRFTPGPWLVHSYRYKELSHFMIDVGPRGLAVAKVIGKFELKIAGNEAEANARLIATAPDLLVSLGALLGLIAQNLDLNALSMSDQDILARARLQIAQAEGE